MAFARGCVMPGLGQREPGAALGWPRARGSRFWGATSWIIASALVPRLRRAPGALLPTASSLPFAIANCCLGHAKKKPNSFPTFVNRRQNISKNGAMAAVISGLMAAVCVPCGVACKKRCIFGEGCLCLPFTCAFPVTLAPSTWLGAAVLPFGPHSLVGGRRGGGGGWCDAVTLLWVG